MKPCTCIIIEDQPEFVEILSYYLRKIPEVSVISSHKEAEDAIVAIEQHKPDFIFLDVTIAGGKGPDFIQKLTHKPKVVIISGHTEAFMKHYPEVSYVDFLQKPPTLDKLKQAIEKCV